MKHKPSQFIMVWLFPVIVIGGLFFPLLGYLVLLMMIYFLGLSFSKPRHWCWNLCPRGSFLDIVMPKLGFNKPLPHFLTGKPARIVIIVSNFIISFFVWRLIRKDDPAESVGAVFVALCLVTSVSAIILSVLTKPRSWCVICPMGSLQGHIGKKFKKQRKESHV